MLLPIRHEQMSARRWPVVTFALIALNAVIFVGTHQTMEDQGNELGRIKAHMLILAAMHPDLHYSSPKAEQFVNSFRDHNPKTWQQLQQPNRDVVDAWDARVRIDDDPTRLQTEMDVLTSQYAQLSAVSIADRFAFIPARPRWWTYITANFLHGGWLHLIGNMWFLWLAGFVLEDAWGRYLYSAFYLIAGAAALQFHAWTNAASLVPAIGASGAVAGLMGAFLVRFPRMKIEMIWLFWLRIYRFKAPAYWLLPLWLFTEVFFGALFGQSSGVAHWAHVGGFLFGAAVGWGLHYSGLEQKASAAIEAEVSWVSDAPIGEATDLIGQGRLDEAIMTLNNYLAQQPNSVDAANLLQQAYFRKEDIPNYQQATVRLCDQHLKARAREAAWQDYEDFLKSGGTTMPPATWLDLCHVAEERKEFDRALSEYQKLIAAYPLERQSLAAQVGAGRVCLKRLNRPSEALKYFEAAANSVIPHLDWDVSIEAGLKEAKAALNPAAVSVSSTPAAKPAVTVPAAPTPTRR